MIWLARARRAVGLWRGRYRRPIITQINRETCAWTRICYLCSYSQPPV